MAHPRILIDARMIGPVGHGIARYVTLLAEGLSRIENLPYEPVFIVRADRSPPQSMARFQTRSAESFFLNPKELIEIPQILSRERAALYHSPSFSSLIYCPCPHIMTLHDLIHLHFGSTREKIYYHTILKRFAHQAQAVIAVSEYSKREVSRWLKKNPDEIEIAWNALDPSLGRELSAGEASHALKELGLESGRFFFCLSNPKPHKNVPLLAMAYKRYRDLASDPIPLVLSLPKGAGHSSLKGPGILRMGGISDREIRVLLSHATGMFFPSLEEGFGLPPIEAVCAGALLAVSNIPAHREGLIELGPEEVLWVDPKDIAGWTQAFHILQNRKQGAVSRSSREKTLQRFSVDRLGKTMDQIYRSVLSRNLAQI